MIRTLFGLVLLSLVTACSGKRQADYNLSKKAIDGIRSRVFADGKVWMTENLAVDITESYCQRDDTVNCNQYGRLYTWVAAAEGCRKLGDGWRLPTDEEWKDLAGQYGGIVTVSQDQGKSAYEKLMAGGISEFNAQLGGNRETDGTYQRLGAHGFYWTASEYDSSNAWFYNFAKGSVLLNHHSGNKARAASVRCIKD